MKQTLQPEKINRQHVKYLLKSLYLTRTGTIYLQARAYMASITETKVIETRFDSDLYFT